MIEDPIQWATVFFCAAWLFFLLACAIYVVRKGKW
jgi:hypothetical protein